MNTVGPFRAPYRTGAVLLAGLTLIGVTSNAHALPGYANLINGYCRQQGAARARYTDDGCTLCHHQGTFVTDPEHRIEPVWTQFEIGRTSGDYRFFCPAGGASSAATPLAEAALAEAVAAKAGDEDSPHNTMAWMALGYPAGHEVSVSGDAKDQDIPAPAKPTSTAPSAKALPTAPTANPPDAASDAAAELTRKLAKLREDLGIGRAQDLVWKELQEAVLASATGASAVTKNADLEAALQERQRAHALRIAQLRAVNTAAVRLSAQLDEPKKRLLAKRLPPLIGE